MSFQHTTPLEMDLSHTPGPMVNQSLKTCPELLLVESQLHESLQGGSAIIKEYCTRLLSSGGKRLRPLLTLTSARCFGPLTKAAIQTAVAAELIHMASLIHDDVIDQSELRRGVATLNAEINNHAAVLTGDYIFAEAFHILSSQQLLSSLGYLVEAIQKMCAGEVQQAQERFNIQVSIEDYFSRISQKTGVLLASCCKSGAATSGASAEEIASLGEYGLHLGNAYQIIDDMLDFTGLATTTGKPVAYDLNNGYITLPVLYLLRHPLYGPWVAEILGKKEIPPKEIQQIIQALSYSGALDEAFQAAQASVDKALAALDRVPPSMSRDLLGDMAHRVLQRKF